MRAANMVGAQVVLAHEGRDLLGDVVGARGRRLLVRHFNGEAWPFSPLASEVTFLERWPDVGGVAQLFIDADPVAVRSLGVL